MDRAEWRGDGYLYEHRSCGSKSGLGAIEAETLRVAGRAVIAAPKAGAR